VYLRPSSPRESILSAAAPVTVVRVDGAGNFGGILQVPNPRQLVLLFPGMLMVVKGQSGILAASHGG
jgi:hypothetical protein